MKYKLLLLTGIIVFLGGCQKAYKVTYNSKPQGATVICDNKSYGYTPIQLNYTLQDGYEKFDDIKVNPCKAQWVSGAQTDYSEIFNMKKYPNGVMQTVKRPIIGMSMFNYDKDIEFEKRLQEEKKKGIEASRIAIFSTISTLFAINAINAINQQNQAIGQHISNNPSLHLRR